MGRTEGPMGGTGGPMLWRPYGYALEALCMGLHWRPITALEAPWVCTRGPMGSNGGPMCCTGIPMGSWRPYGYALESLRIAGGPMDVHWSPNGYELEAIWVALEALCVALEALRIALDALWYVFPSRHYG